VKWLLDTNVVSESVRPRPSLRVLRWLDDQPSHLTAISVVTLAELQHGVWLTAGEDRRAELSNWLDREVLPTFAGRIMPVSTDVLIHWFGLQRSLSKRRQTRSPADLLLAATAQVHDLRIVTRNIRDFANTGITVYNPWTNETEKMEAP